MDSYTPQQARKIKDAIVYGIAGEDGAIVYVGKTIRPAQRIAQYINPGLCHNAMLADWLARHEGRWRLVVLDRNPDDINASERRHIKARHSKTFNLIAGGEQAWRNHVAQPWMAGTGIKCPSDMLLTRLKVNGGDLELCRRVRDMRKGMSTLERCKYEIALAMDVESEFPGMMPQVSRWLERVSDKVLAVLEADI